MMRLIEIQNEHDFMACLLMQIAPNASLVCHSLTLHIGCHGMSVAVTAQQSFADREMVLMNW